MPTCTERAFVILRDLARGGEDTIMLSDIIQRVEAGILEQGSVISPGCAKEIKKAIEGQVRIRRLNIQYVQSGDAKIVLNTVGIKHFKYLGLIRPLESEDPQLQKMSKEQIAQETEKLRNLARQMQEVFHELRPDSQASRTIHELANGVRDTLDATKTLAEQGVELNRTAAANSKRIIALTNHLKKNEGNISHASESSRTHDPNQAGSSNVRL